MGKEYTVAKSDGRIGRPEGGMEIRAGMEIRIPCPMTRSKRSSGKSAAVTESKTTDLNVTRATKYIICPEQISHCNRSKPGDPWTLLKGSWDLVSRL